MSSVNNQPPPIQNLDLRFSIPPPGEGAVNVNVVRADGSVVGEGISVNRHELMQNVAHAFGYPDVDTMESAQGTKDLAQMAILLNVSLQYPDGDPLQVQLDNADPTNPQIPVSKALLNLNMQLVAKGDLAGAGVAEPVAAKDAVVDPLLEEAEVTETGAQGPTKAKTLDTTAPPQATAKGDAATGTSGTKSKQNPNANMFFASSPVTAFWMAVSKLVKEMMQMELSESDIRTKSQNMSWGMAQDAAQQTIDGGENEATRLKITAAGDITSAVMTGASGVMEGTGAIKGAMVPEDAPEPFQKDEMQSEQLQLQDPGNPPDPADPQFADKQREYVAKQEQNVVTQAKNEQIKDNNATIKANNAQLTSEQAAMETAKARSMQKYTKSPQRVGEGSDQYKQRIAREQAAFDEGTTNAKTEVERRQATIEGLKAENTRRMESNQNLLKPGADAHPGYLDRGRAALTNPADGSSLNTRAGIAAKNTSITQENTATKTANTNTKTENENVRRSNKNLERAREHYNMRGQMASKFFQATGQLVKGSTEAAAAGYVIDKASNDAMANLKNSAGGIYTQNAQAASEAFKNDKELLSSALQTFGQVSQTTKDSNKFSR